MWAVTRTRRGGPSSRSCVSNVAAQLFKHTITVPEA